MELNKELLPIVEIPLQKNVKLFVKREDLVHCEISGNKYWKMFYNIKNYLSQGVEAPMIVTFGGAYSNHIAATAAVGYKFGIKTLGIIRGEELEGHWQGNPTLDRACQQGMDFLFITREEYRDKETITQKIKKQYPDALIVPEGGTNEWAVEGIKYMLDERTKEFDYICTAVGTGGTISGLIKFSEKHQKVLGFKVVDDVTLEERIVRLSGSRDFSLFDAHDGRYGKIIDENISFINDFYQKYNLPLDPIYTGKMMRNVVRLIDEGYFLQDSKILAFHTGGLQGILGANDMLKRKNKELINIKI